MPESKELRFDSLAMARFRRVQLNTLQTDDGRGIQSLPSKNTRQLAAFPPFRRLICTLIQHWNDMLNITAFNQLSQHLQYSSSLFCLIGRGGRFFVGLAPSPDFIICLVRLSNSSFTFWAVFALVSQNGIWYLVAAC